MTVQNADDRAASIDEILDTHAHGLLYFERFLPLASRVPGTRWPSYRDVCARFDEQRGLNLRALSDDAAAIAAMSAALEEQLQEQVQLRRVLQLRWHGQAGDAVQNHLAGTQEAASSLLTSLDDSHRTMSAAVDVLREAVIEKAELIGALDSDAVDGKNADQVDAILAASGIECLPVDRESVFPRLDSAFPELDEQIRGGDLTDEFAGTVAARCRDWVESQFVPSVERTCDAVLGACSATDHAVRECLGLMIEVMNAVHDPGFAEIDEQGWTVEQTGSGATENWDRWSSRSFPTDTISAAAEPGLSNAGPGGAGYISSAPAGALGIASHDPAWPEQASSPSDGGGAAVRSGSTGDLGPAGIAGIVGGLVDRVIRDIADQVEVAVERALDTGVDARDRAAFGDKAEPLPEPSQDSSGSTVPATGSDSAVDPGPTGVDLPLTEPATGERGHLEAELDGHRARIAVVQGGAITLELETPGLGTRAFELRIGPLGLPEIVPILGVGLGPEVLTEGSVPRPTDPGGPTIQDPQTADIEPVDVQPGNVRAVDSPPMHPQPPVTPRIPESEPESEPGAESASEPVSEPAVEIVDQCLPVSSGLEPPSAEALESDSPQEGASGDHAVHPDSAHPDSAHPDSAHPDSAQQPVAGDRPVPDVDPEVSETGASLSEAGAL